MKNRIDRLSKAISRRGGLFLLLAALIVSLGIVRVSQDGLPFVGGGNDSVNVKVTELTRENFQSELSTVKGPIFVALVRDNADSRAARIIIEEAGKPYVGKITFYTVDMTAQKEITQLFQSILVQAGLPLQRQMPDPLYILFKVNPDSGEPELMNVGAMVVPTAALAQFFEEGLNPPPAAPAGTTPGGTPSATPGAPSQPSGTQSGPATTSPTPPATATPNSGN